MFQLTLSVIRQNIQVPVFQIFDDEGDGLLSYQGFVAMMKDRIHRGLKTYSRSDNSPADDLCPVKASFSLKRPFYTGCFFLLVPPKFG